MRNGRRPDHLHDIRIGVTDPHVLEHYDTSERAIRRMFESFEFTRRECLEAAQDGGPEEVDEILDCLVSEGIVRAVA